MLDLDFVEATNPGCARSNNEDFFGSCIPESSYEGRTRGWFFTVADGVGGQDLGEVASRTAVQRVLQLFRSAGPGETHSSLLPKIIQRANVEVYETGRSAAPGGLKMATTIVACALRFDRVVVAHVGDSRCILVRNGRAEDLTRDHTVVNEQVRLGIMSAKEASQAETRHVLTRSLGNDLFVKVDVDEQQVIPGDTLVLCTDGLHGPVPPQDIARVVTSAQSLSAAAERLVELAIERDGGDNITFQLIRVRNVERIGMYRGRPYKLR